jgi:formate dehydrogenase subunit gamma
MTPPDKAATGRRIRRFTPAEHWVHRTTSALMLICLVTAAMLYLPALAEIVGRRRLVVTVHEWAGIMLPVPVLAGLASRAFRHDLKLLNRFASYDWSWLRDAIRRRPESLRLAGKFNAGQKVYASFAAGAALVMIGTGLMMWFPNMVVVTLRTGATFVHDWLALAIGAVVIGHIWMAARDPEARLGMRTGFVTPQWVRDHHPKWQHDGAAEDSQVKDKPRTPAA